MLATTTTTFDFMKIAQMSWEERLMDHSRVFGDLSHAEARLLNGAHAMAAAYLGGGKDAQNLTPDDVGPLKTAADSRNNATLGNAETAAKTVKEIDTTKGDDESWAKEMDMAMEEQIAADTAATKRTYELAKQHIKTLPAESRSAATNVFVGAMSFVSEAYKAVSKLLSDAFASLVQAINKAIQAVQDAAIAAGNWVAGAAASVADFFRNLF